MGNFNLSYGKLFAKLFLEKAEIASPINQNLILLFEKKINIIYSDSKKIRKIIKKNLDNLI